MSPIAGVGINLAIQDAVAAADLLTEPLLRGTLTERDLARVQRRRSLPTHASVLAHVCSWDDGALLAVHNLGAEPRTVPVVLEGCDSSHHLEDLLQRGSTPLSDKGEAELALDGYGYRWLRVVGEDDRRLV
jgi:hypothetical protein